MSRGEIGHDARGTTPSQRCESKSICRSNDRFRPGAQGRDFLFQAVTRGKPCAQRAAKALRRKARIQECKASTVSAPGAEPAVIRTALYKDATGLVRTVSLPQDYAELVADKIRPHVYAHRGGTSIDVYNAYTAQKIATLSGVGSALGQMAVSPDGSKLFVLDTAVRSLRVVDLSTNAVTAWPLANGVSADTTLLAIRPNGVEVVLVGDGSAYTAGRSLGTTGIQQSMTASSDGRKTIRRIAASARPASRPTTSTTRRWRAACCW